MEGLQAVKAYLEERIAYIKTVDGRDTAREVELQKVLNLVNTEIG